MNFCSYRKNITDLRCGSKNMNTGKPCINSYKYLSNVRCSYYQVLKELGAKKDILIVHFFLRNSTNYPCFNTEV